MSKLEVEYRPLAELQRWPGNPKTHDAVAIRASVARYGFRDPIAVNIRTGEIEEGHGRLEMLEAAKKAGQAPPPFVQVDEHGEWLVPVLRFDDDDATARGYALAHNRTMELGGYDDALLLHALKEQTDAGALAATGFDGDDVQRLEKALAKAAEDAPSFDLPSVFKVIVTCTDEHAQAELLDRLTGEGYDVQALAL